MVYFERQFPSVLPFKIYMILRSCNVQKLYVQYDGLYDELQIQNFQLQESI